MLRPLLLALFSGLLYVFSFAPWDQGYLQWVAFIPLFIAVQLVTDQTPTKDQTAPKFSVKIKRKLFLLGFVVSVCICLGGFYWIVYATQRYGGLPLPAALLLMTAFCIFGQLQVPLYLLLRHYALRTDFFSRKASFWILLSGFLYAGIESFYPKLFLDTAGHAFYREVWFRQGADLGGPFFLTALIIGVNELFFRAYARKRIQESLVALFIIGASAGYGAWRVNTIHALEAAHAADPHLRVSMIQANIGDFLKVQAERGVENASRQVIGQYLTLSRQAAITSPKPDVILWPETAYPALFGKPYTVPEQIMELEVRAFARDFGRTFLFGGYDQDPPAAGTPGADYNSLYFYQAAKESKQIYHKAILLMFGETLPLAETFPAMKTWFPTMGFFGRGPGARVFEVRNENGFPFLLAPSICYEGLFTAHAVAGAELQADALVNVTNDSWFGPQGEPYLHLALTIFRTIETRVPMLRSTNTGFTTVIDSTGEIVQTTHLFTSEVLTTSVSKRLVVSTPYLAVARVLGGDWFVQLCQLMTLGLLVYLAGAAKTRKNH